MNDIRVDSTPPRRRAAPGRVVGLLLAAVLASALPGARAHADGYVAAGWGATHHRVLCNGGACDRRDTGVRVTLGWTFAPRWSAELLYLDAGTFTASDRTAEGVAFRGRDDVHGIGAALQYRVPLGATFDAGVRLGAASMKSEFSPGPAPAIAGGRTTTQLLYGAGARWTFAPSWSLRADWDRTRARMNRFNGNVDAVTVGVQYSF